ncbi:hypothetical protein DXA68_05150 [Bacteroides stercorirosoris]|uniref:Uncharacterized protein n=1 Tax=Bacteroides stercorirosoris TaxID=871324 RepID=A0A413H8U3_9BACE|nr:hypothetical protein DXA68_05150 [Bacteroides stercorirosoris]
MTIIKSGKGELQLSEKMVNTTRRVEIWHFLRICFRPCLPLSMFSQSALRGKIQPFSKLNE